LRSKILTLAVVLGSLTGFRLIGIAAGPPATIITWNGTPQSTAANTNFQVALVAVVRDANGNGVSGSTVTFTAPGGGAAGATFSGSATATATTNGSGAATAPTLTANGVGGTYSVTATVAGVAGSAIFSMTNTGGTGGTGAPQAPVGLRFFVVAGTPASVSPAGGTPQGTTINTPFAPLQAVVKDAGSNPISGVSVTFASPSSGASGLFGGSTSSTVTTNTSGVATAVTLTANGTVGSYVVTATVTGVPPASFSLTNLAVPTGGGGGGTWVNVTPAGVDLTNDLNCGNYGTISAVSDPLRPSNLYTQFNCQGIWRSTDYGLTWTGPINTGSGGQGAKGAGGIAIAPGPAGQPPILYSAGIRGTGMGFWRSLDGGVSWTNFVVTPSGSRQDYYPPVVDPYNPNHVILNGHEMNVIVQSMDGGQTWTSVPMAAGMNENGGTGFITFVNTGNAATTANTWLWIGQQNGGTYGTWRTSNGGSSWTQVDKNEHPHGESQFYQPDASGVIYMAGVNSGKGWGVLRSTDYGQTWAHVGNTSGEGIVFGTPNHIYAMWAWACAHCTVDPAFEVGPAGGLGTWTSVPTPASMSMGGAQAAVVFDGTHYVIVTANWLSGLWRYVEP
jgi:hypothetical protein